MIARGLAYTAALGTSALVGMAAATETVAALLGFQPVLGRPLAHVGALAIYEPWAIAGWLRWRDTVPAIDVGVMLAAGIVVGTAVVIGRTARRGRSSFGAATWGTRRDARRAGLMLRKPAGSILGRWAPGGKVLSFDGPEHCLIAGPSRSGKTAGVVIPSLLTNTNSMVLYDPKSELWDISAAWRSRVSEAFFLDFTDPDSARFNPLDVIRMGTIHQTADVQNVVAVLVDPGGSKSSLDYWDKDASQLLLGIILLALTGGDYREKNLAAVRDRLLDLPTTLAAMIASPHREVEKIGRSFADMPPKQLYGVKATCDSLLIVFADPLVSRLTRRSDFALEQLVTEERAMSLYIQAPPSDATRLRPLTRLILSQIVAAMLEDVATVRGKPKRRRLELIIDEFATLGRLDCFTTWVRLMAGYGLRAMLVLQSDRDLADAYGPTNTISENCPIQVIFPTSDDGTLRRISTAIGNDEEPRESRTIPSWWGGHGSRNLSEHRRPVMEPAAIRCLDAGEQLVIATACKPLRTRKIRWWREEPFAGRGTNIVAGEKPPGQHPHIVKLKRLQP